MERPGGTFYIFPKALEEDANAFCLKAREFDLLLVPSDTFGVKGYVRLASVSYTHLDVYKRQFYNRIAYVSDLYTIDAAVDKFTIYLPVSYTHLDTL